MREAKSLGISKRFLMAAAVLILLGGSLAAGAAVTLPPLRLSEFAPALHDQVRSFYQAARKNPPDAAAIGRLGMMFHAYLRFESAAACYRIARSLEPVEKKWTYYLGTVAAELGKHAESETLMDAFLRQQPDYLPALLQRAESLFKLGRLDLSAQLYQAVLRLQPDCAAAHYGIGRVFADRNNRVEAISHLQRALEIFPGFGAAHYALAMAYRDSQQPDQARRQLALYEKSRPFLPHVPDTLLDAVEQLNEGAEHHIKKGVGLQSAGLLADAAVEHEKALQIDPKSTQARVNLITIYGKLGEVEKAERQYRALVEIQPNVAEGHYNFGVLMASRERFQEAAEAFRKTLEVNPSHAEARNNYAFLLMTEGNLQEAEQQYRAALESKPGHRLAHFNLGRILVARERVPEAIEHFLQTLEPDDDDTPRYMYALGAAYARLGDREKALHYIRGARTRAVAWGQQELLSSIERDLRVLEAP
ncbi:MAG TPA: tetratricopeptide repeat protein [Acidobacteriota bacterium]